jgi:hypothetical protein
LSDGARPIKAGGDTPCCGKIESNFAIYVFAGGRDKLREKIEKPSNLQLRAQPLLSSGKDN